MKHNWEYKQLGDICDKGSSNLMQKNLEIIDNGFEVFGASGSLGKIDFYQQEAPYVGIVKDGSGVGRCNLYPAKSSLLGTMQYIIAKNCVSNEYLCYLMQSLNLSKYVNGAAIPHIYFRDYKKEIVPVPPMEVQERIVAELDKINDVIEDCRELLRNLDALAQSLFYDFFGDPITNSKGWEIKPLKDAVIEMFLGPFGSALKTDCYVPEEDSFAMVYEQKHAIKKTLAQENNFINEDKFFALKRFEVLPFDFIMSCRGTIGQLYQVPENAPRGIIHPSVMKIRLNSSTYGSVFFKFLLPIIIKEQQTKGNCVQMAITAKELGAKKLPVPPFSLQEKFAERIEQIEAQKKAVESTIAELQTLLDSRMDYWFN